MDFEVRGEYGGNYYITGDTLVEAIKSNFKKIAYDCVIGNAAGYTLDKLTVEYKESILGGTGGAVLTIVAHGSDALVNYDPENDPTRTKTVWIKAKPEDVPERYEFELKHNPDPPFDPFTCEIDNSKISYYYGIACALVDRLISNYRGVPDDLNGVGYTESLDARFRNLKRVNPKKYIEQIYKGIERYHIKQHPEATRLRARIDELLENVAKEPFELNAMYYLGYDHTEFYFKTQGKRILYYRKIAGLTQQQVADAAGINLRLFQKFEGGERSLTKASYQTVSAISYALHVDPKVLTGIDYQW